jgi:DNA-directed RNA polymerase subunit M/transcription elongation factor TFIIS
MPLPLKTSLTILIMLKFARRGVPMEVFEREPKRIIEFLSGMPYYQLYLYINRVMAAIDTITDPKDLTCENITQTSLLTISKTPFTTRLMARIVAGQPTNLVPEWAIHKCRNCGSNRIIIGGSQTRRGDESMTATFDCSICGAHWRK